MTERELTEWMAFYLLEPWGAKANDARAANVMSVLASALWTVRATVVKVWTGKRLSKEKYKTEDFMPRYGQPKQKMSWQHMLSIVKALNTKMGGKDKTSGH